MIFAHGQARAGEDEGVSLLVEALGCDLNALVCQWVKRPACVLVCWIFVSVEAAYQRVALQIARH